MNHIRRHHPAHFPSVYCISSSHLISPFQSGLCSFAPFFHRFHKDAESSLAASLHAERQLRLPGCLLQSDLSPLSLGGACYVQQSQMALHFLAGSDKWENADELLFSTGVELWCARKNNTQKIIKFKRFELLKSSSLFDDKLKMSLESLELRWQESEVD